MEEDPFGRTSPTTTNDIKRLSADPSDRHIRLYRAVIKEDIRLRHVDKGDDEDEEDNEDGNDEDNNEDGDEDDDVDPRLRIDLDRDPIEYHIYEVWAQKHRKSVKYWIYSADYVVEGGAIVYGVEGEATRAEAIEHVEEACSYEDAEDMNEDRGGFDWASKDAEGNKTVDFPEDDKVLSYLLENES